MHRDEWTADSVITAESGDVWTLRYYVRVKTAENGQPVYGVKVEKYAANGLLIEKEHTPCFTESYADASGLARLFARGSVTPSVLLEMTDECLSLPATVQSAG